MDNDFIEPSQSDWSSPCIPVPKPDGTLRMCTDYRKVNSVTRIDSFPVPRMDNCTDNIGQAKYVAKFHLLKGFWQIPLMDGANEISAFVIPDGLYQDCQKAFDILKAILKNEPVLLAPNFAKEFKLAVEASDTGAGSVLMQEDGNGVDHPVSYFSIKFNKHQKNYSTIEKELLSLILALQHFLSLSYFFTVTYCCFQ